MIFQNQGFKIPKRPEFKSFCVPESRSEDKSMSIEGKLNIFENEERYQFTCECEKL